MAQENILTEKEYALYKFLIDYVKENGYSPSYSEIAKGIGIKANSTVMERLQSLQKKGKIQIKVNIPRAIKIVGYEFVKMKHQ